MTTILSRGQIAIARVANAAAEALDTWCPTCGEEVSGELVEACTAFGRPGDSPIKVCVRCGTPLGAAPRVADPRYLDACEVAHDVADALAEIRYPGAMARGALRRYQKACAAGDLTNDTEGACP